MHQGKHVSSATVTATAALITLFVIVVILNIYISSLLFRMDLFVLGSLLDIGGAKSELG